MLRVVVPVNGADPQDPLRLLQVVEPVAKQLQLDAEKVQAGYNDYQEISFSRTALKHLYALTLTLTLLLALFSALGLAVVLSEQFSRPLGLLAEGTRAVAQGDFSRRNPVQSRDELGVLTESFNTMTAQLADAQQKAEESRHAIETTRAYLESILANLSAGVLAFDDAFRLAHRQSQRCRDPAATARRTGGRAARRLGAAPPGPRRRLPNWSRKVSPPAATGNGSGRPSSPSPITRACC